MLKLEWEIKMLESGIPEKYRASCWDNYEGKKDSISYNKLSTYCDRLGSARRKGVGILLQGEEDSGKTYVGVCILKEALKKNFTVYYTTLNQIIEDIKKTYEDNSYKAVVDERYMWTDFLFIDSLNMIYKAKESDYVDSTLAILVNHRDLHNRPIILAVDGQIENVVDDNKYSQQLYKTLKTKLLEVTLVKSGYSQGVQKRMMMDLMEDE